MTYEYESVLTGNMSHDKLLVTFSDAKMDRQVNMVKVYKRSQMPFAEPMPSSTEY